MSEKPSESENIVFPFYKKNVENFFTGIALLLCVLSFIYSKNMVILIAFFAFTAIFLAYYIFWQKKGSTYIKIDEKEITVYQGLFFKPVTFQRNEIRSIQSNRFYFKLILPDNRKKVFIFPLLLTDNDINSLKKFLSSHH